MDSNTATLTVLICYWLLMDRRIGLCLVIIAYYSLYLITELTDAVGYFGAGVDLTFATYLLQLSVDAVVLICIAALSVFYHNSVKILLLYSFIVSTSFLLNGLMIYDQVLELSIIYSLHTIRQEFSIPLDVLFAVLWSALHAGQNTLDNLRTGHSSIYNRLNRYFQTLGNKQ